MKTRIDPTLGGRTATITQDLMQLTTKSNSTERSADARFEQTLQKVHLMTEQTHAVDYWVRGGWSSLNRALRGVMPDKERVAYEIANSTIGGVNYPAATVEQRASALDNALERLPDYTQPTYRTARYDNPATYAERITPGDFLFDAGYTATATIRGAGGGAAVGGGGGTGEQVYFKVYSRSGKFISPYSHISSEREVLLPRGRHFKVLAIGQKANTFFVVCEESTPTGGATVRNQYNGETI